MRRDAAIFNIKDHKRHTPSIRRRVKSPRMAVQKEPLKPNPRNVTTPTCSAIHGLSCRCKRLSGQCMQCRRDVVVSHGERADSMSHDSKGRLAGYLCVRCRRTT